MELKIAPNDVQSMSQDGDSILRSLQNKSMPMIDLLVRESLQNSLDATRKNEENTLVNFSTGYFKTDKLNRHFDGISDTLANRYNQYSSYLAVRDANTTGLTGDYKSESQAVLDQSNFHKLVFGIGKNQEKAGSGGSWGLGKTSYFRVGIGLVIYYTRVLSEGVYEERLIASLIESPKDTDRLLPESERGIAWWGKYETEGKKIFPLTDSKVISEILDIFDIDQYTDDETGTTIIIPYLKEEHIDDTSEILPWDTDYSDSIKMAIKRWYHPRLANDSYSQEIGNSKLLCTVNNEILFLEEPIFRKFQQLYNAALTGTSEESHIYVKDIFLPRTGMADNKIKVGSIAFCETSRDEMEMQPPYNRPSPLDYLGLAQYNSRFDSKVIAYSRMPGMVVEYDLNGEWSPSGNILSEESMLLGFFVPNSFGSLHQRYIEMGYDDLESYLRATENADHADWIDEDGITIVKRTKGYTAKEIQEHYQVLDGDSYSSATSALSRKFGSILMPPRSFGRKSNKTDKNKKNVKKKKSTRRTSNLNILSTDFINTEYVKVRFSVILKPESQNHISLLVLTQEKKMSSEMWDKFMNDVIPFPFKIIDEPELSKNSLSEDNLNIEVYKNNDFSVVINNNNTQEVELTGSVSIKVYSNQYMPTLTVTSNKLAKEDI
ncbi:hypothetical protein SAMN04488102_102161 [Alkalibacterium subtropicum]|uniref:Histidine kinase-, DNA gyrase B-, and HSP90-like ATPase n=1 Tax=Alkalibacterium subtropicum TaxID=753702 RepID=A0A1I1FT76_9LACT|nr:hypothetical protein [Alkalibacterium subtropicum]SFC00273.1 hypothetical protein SAMN04488102_102161 [Alkalibacterium subtropicum]